MSCETVSIRTELGTQLGQIGGYRRPRQCVDEMNETYSGTFDQVLDTDAKKGGAARGPMVVVEVEVEVGKKRHTELFEPASLSRHSRR